ncbi:MAG: DUF429 domain-containing protein [Ignisphaera sp.]
MQVAAKVFYIGLDLAAKPSRCTGFVVISDTEHVQVIEAKCLNTDDEIIQNVLRYNNAVIAVDAPFGFGDGYLRRVDRKMISLGYRVLPPGLHQMKELTRRAISIVGKLIGYGLTVIETHPRSVLKSSKCNSLEDLANKLGIDTSLISTRSKDIRDAFLAAVAALCFVRGCSNPVQESDGVIWLVKEICY